MEQDSNTNTRRFITVRPHPRNPDQEVRKIYLDEPETTNQTEQTSTTAIPIPQMPIVKPWAPFRTLPDFEYTEIAVRGAFPASTVNLQLHGMQHGWAEKSNITLRNKADMDLSLQAARKYGIEVRLRPLCGMWNNLNIIWKCTSLNAARLKLASKAPHIHSILNTVIRGSGVLRSLLIQRLCLMSAGSPIKKNFTRARALSVYMTNRAPLSAGGIFKSVKVYCHSNLSDRNTLAVQDELPHDAKRSHCFFPLHLWMDKAKVSKKVRKHPIVLRAACLPSSIRNGSGNGGGVLIGYMPVVSYHSLSARKISPQLDHGSGEP